MKLCEENSQICGRLSSMKVNEDQKRQLVKKKKKKMIKFEISG